MGLNQGIDITTDQRKTTLALLRKHLPNTTAWVYGSRAKWTSRPQSDLDMVVFASSKQGRKVSDLREAFQDSNLPFRVDLFVWDAVPEQFRKQIEAEHVVLVEGLEAKSTQDSDWQITRWGELASLEYGKALRNYKSSTGPYKVFGTNGPIGCHDEMLCAHSGVIIGRKGAYRGIHYSPRPFFVIDTAFYLKPKAEMDTRWAYYQLLDQNINDLDSGSAIPSTRREDFYSLPVKVPPLAEQRAIAHILGTLDDKIELNRRMNETLEEMARALFKSWFVDFLPVRAKMAAKQNNPSLLLPQAGSGTWFVYAIEYADGSLYIGQTENLRQRWLQHSSSKGGRWTKSHPPQRVAYWEKQPSRQAAVEREEWLKTGFGRKWLKKEIVARTQTGDPARAKMEGRWRAGESLPGLPAHLYELFPDKLVPSELGEIPEGWEVKTLGEQLKILVSGARPRGGAIDVGIPSIGAENVDGLGRHDYSKEKYIPTEFFDKLKSKGAKVRNGDVLLYKDGANIGRKTYLDCGFPYSECAVNEHVFILRLKNSNAQRYLFFWLDQDWMTLEIISLNSNSAQPGINQVGVHSLPFLAPSSEVLCAFNKVASQWADRLFANCHESRALATQRDAMLPKLISGDLRVRGVGRSTADLTPDVTGVRA